MEASEYFSEGQLKALNFIIDERIKSMTTQKEFEPLVQWCNQNSISVSKVYKLRSEGKIQFHYFGKNAFIKPSDVIALMSNKGLMKKEN